VTGRSEHLTVYGLVGVAMFVVVGVLIVASNAVISSAWLATLVVAWAAAAVVAAVMWRRTVWIPLLASLGLSTVWMVVFFGSR
jgi:hypothetical protein